MTIQCIRDNQAALNVHFFQQLLHRRDFVALVFDGFGSQRNANFTDLRTNNVQWAIHVFLANGRTNRLPIQRNGCSTSIEMVVPLLFSGKNCEAHFIMHWFSVSDFTIFKSVNSPK